MKIHILNRQRHHPLDTEKIGAAARTILSLLKQSRLKGTELSLLFVGDRKMLQLNKMYRGISRSTDVLSFEAQIGLESDSAPNILGDIVINVPRAEAQAREYGSGFYDEIYRLLIHGTLHLLGYDHEQSDRQARKMRKKEQELFHAAQKMDSERQSRD